MRAFRVFSLLAPSPQDLMEEINGDSVEHFTYHVSPRNATKCKGGPVQQHAGGEVTLGPTMASGQHEYAVEIALGQFSFVVDGKVFFSNNNATGLPVHDVPWCVGVVGCVPLPPQGRVNAATTAPASDLTTTVATSQVRYFKFCNWRAVAISSRRLYCLSGRDAR